MRVKVIKCSDPLFWYADKIGEEFDVVKALYNDVVTVSNNILGAWNIVEGDYEVVESKPLGTPEQYEATDKLVKILKRREAEERTIKMSLETAREMYYNGTEIMKQWVLENFTKEELEKKKGFDWGNSFDGSGYYISSNSKVCEAKNFQISSGNLNTFRTREQAESALAFAQLSHIVAKYNEGKALEGGYYSVNYRYGKLDVLGGYPSKKHLEFHTKEDAETSREVNRELWKKYWMVK